MDHWEKTVKTNREWKILVFYEISDDWQYEGFYEVTPTPPRLWGLIDGNFYVICIIYPWLLI